MKYRSMMLGVVSAVVMPMIYADNKIAVVDIKSIAQKSPEITKLNKQLEEKYKPMQEALMKRDNAWREKSEKLKKEGMTMSKDEKSKMQASLDKERAQLQEEQSKFQETFFQDFYISHVIFDINFRFFYCFLVTHSQK